MFNTTKKNIASIEYAVNNPNNIRLYHGGTHLLRENLFKNGFEYIGRSVWNCSEEDKVYFYEFNRFAKSESIEDDDFDCVQDRVMQRANENGQIQEALLDNPGKYTYVFEFVLPKEAERFIEIDDSCENMELYGAVQMDMDIINMFIELGKCTVNVYKYDFFPKMSYFYIAGLVDNEYATDFLYDLSSAERRAIEAINNSDTCSIYEEVVLEVYPTFDICNGQLDSKHYHD